MSTEVKNKLTALDELRHALRSKLSFCAADVLVARQTAPNKLAKAKDVRREINRALNKVDALHQKLPSNPNELNQYVNSEEFSATYEAAKQTHREY